MKKKSKRERERRKKSLCTGTQVTKRRSVYWKGWCSTHWSMGWMLIRIEMSLGKNDDILNISLSLLTSLLKCVWLLSGTKLQFVKYSKGNVRQSDCTRKKKLEKKRREKNHNSFTIWFTIEVADSVLVEETQHNEKALVFTWMFASSQMQMLIELDITQATMREKKKKRKERELKCKCWT